MRSISTSGRASVSAALAATAVALVAAGCGSGTDDAKTSSEPGATVATATTSTTSSAELGAIKEYLLSQTGKLTGFTAEFKADATRYFELAKATGFDYEALWNDQAAEVGPLLEKMKSDWIAGNPLYERMEGIVAGTPSLATYDVIIDAGSSASEDPASAVPFDLELPDGRVLEQPGNLYNITEGSLWGTLPADIDKGVPADLNGDGKTEFGEVLPDANFLVAAADTFDLYANELADKAQAWQPTESDALTALVVMSPTMSEYFNSWKVSRFVAGDQATGEAFNVVSRLSDITDIIAGLEVIYTGIQPVIETANAAQGQQTGEDLADLKDFVKNIYDQEQSGKRFTAEEADLLGSEAQERGSAIAGQVSQVAAELGIPIQQ
jgi:hypothetical protein